MNTYKNGNYLVQYDRETGSKSYISFSYDENFKPDFPDSLDIKLTNKCGRGCPFCHEDSNIYGEHGDLEELKKVINSLPKYPIELALGGGNLLNFKIENELIPFLKFLKERGHPVGITLHLTDFTSIGWMEAGYELLNSVDSIGISATNSDEILSMLSLKTTGTFDLYRKTNPSLKFVVHLILGTSILTLKRFLTEFNFPGLPSETRILILGYKEIGRGKDWDYKPNQFMFEELRKIIVGDCIRKYIGKNISFDNLAISQLRLREAFTEEVWEKLYMGDDFSHSMYIDAVTKTFGPSSTSKERSPWKDYEYNIVKYFQEKRKEHGK